MTSDQEFLLVMNTGLTFAIWIVVVVLLFRKGK